MSPYHSDLNEADRYVLSIERCLPEDVARVGGKAVGLGSLVAAGFRVPPGFVVTTEAYRRSVAHLEAQLAGALGRSGSRERDVTASEEIRTLLTESVLTADVAAAVTEAYERLGDSRDVPVAVRSSAIAEDTADASSAGQQDTYLWIRGADAIHRHIVACWSSLFTPRAIAYRRRFGGAAEDLAIGVVVQQMVPAESASVMMTLEPATGDSSQIYIESAFGLGEAVVRGEVSPDCFRVDKEHLTLRSAVIGVKERAYRFDEQRDQVRCVEVPEATQRAESLQHAEVVALAELGRRVEVGFGRPMDIEWAVGPGLDGRREVFLLQARPETVWSNRQKEKTTERALAVSDPLMSPSAPDEHWSRSNVGEAVPGVLTPLNWSIWSTVGERTTRGGGFALGALSAREAQAPDAPGERVLRVFHGRLAIKVEFMAMLGDRLPGVTAEDTVMSMCGRIPEGMRFRPSRRRYPIVAWRMTRNFVTYPRAVRALEREFDGWWPRSTEKAKSLDHDGAIASFNEAIRKFEDALLLQTSGSWSSSSRFTRSSRRPPRRPGSTSPS